MRAAFHRYSLAGLLVVLAANAATSTNETPELSPPYAELPPTFWEQHTWTVVCGSVVAIGLLGAGIWLGLRPRPKAEIPPEVLARQALSTLRSQPESAGTWSAVSQILRRYVSTALGLAPGELTTHEVIQTLTARSDVPPELREAIAAFLRQCDEAKFAGRAPVAQGNLAAQALELLERSEAFRARSSGSSPHPSA